MKEGYNMSNEKKQYVFPPNVVFLMGFTPKSNEELILEIIDNDTDHYHAVLSPIYTCETLTHPKTGYIGFKKCGVFLREYVQGFLDVCDEAQKNPDKIILSNVCPLDAFVYAHVLDNMKMISKDAHYYICNMLSMAISPWSIVNYHIVLIYPDLFTVLDSATKEDQSFLEQLHLMYHTYFINHLVQHFKYYKIIETSDIDKRKEKLKSYLNKAYNDYITTKPAFPKYTHPLLVNEQILVDEDEDLKEIQKKFDEERK